MRRNKEQKSLEIFKKGFKKNEIVIYAIALMLVTAGYFNYTSNIENNTIETYAQENKNELVQNFIEENTSSLNENNISTEENSNHKEENKEEIGEITVSNNENETDEDIGNAKLVSSESVTDYFASTKLERDTNYADMISTYTKILEDNSVSETQKSNAMKEITKINNIKNAISVCENILSTKGFINFVVLVNNNSVNVVIDSKDKLTKEKVAQIQNIVSRELNSKIEDIHITEK